MRSKGFDVTDPDDDAPDGAVVGAYERHGERWEPTPVGTKVSLMVAFAQKKMGTGGHPFGGGGAAVGGGV